VLSPSLTYYVPSDLVGVTNDFLQLFKEIATDD
jgi:hypothetical protein